MSIIGILGGGHTARMTAQAAQRLGALVAVLDKDENSPASQVTALAVEGDWNDFDLVSEFAQSCDVVTPESEDVPLAVLEHLEAQGCVVRPSSRTIAATRDRFLQKQLLREAGLPVAPFADAPDVESVRAFAAQYAYPVVLKTRVGGRDGRGNVLVKSAAALDGEFEALAARGALMVEAHQNFLREFAVDGARGQDGKVRVYDTAVTRCVRNVLQAVSAPAPDHFARHLAETGRKAGATYLPDLPALAERVAALIDVIGAFGIELFELRDGSVVINDVTPRPHFAGYWTIEGATTSQFENHVRALLGWPLGWTDMIAPHAAVAALLARGDALPKAVDFVQVAQLRGAHLHWYGKTSSYPMRRLGHVTGLAQTDPEAERIAQMAVVALLGW
jgi:5-(carboxyamino)imidazole ribonucleotide synthase